MHSGAVSRAEIPLFLAAVSLLFFALGDRGLWTAEGRWAEVTREMLLTKDLFHPTINGEPYFDKPLLTYWLIAIVAWLSGSLDEWAVRLPSAVSGLLALWATVSIGRRLWSAEVGRTAGWLLLTTYGLLFWSRTGTSDMENLAAITLALAWYWARRERPDFLGFLVFYLIAFAGALTKGLTALVVPVLAVLPDAFSEGRWRRFLSAPHFLALALAAALYLVPFIYASVTREGYQASGLALVFQENIERYVDPFDHKEPFYVYLYYVPLLFLPWTPLLFTALCDMLPRWRDLTGNTRWLIKATGVILLFFTASGSRRSYYILPILPLCALWVGVLLAGEEREASRSAHSGLRRIGQRLQWMLFGGLVSVQVASPLLWPLVRDRIGFDAPGDLRLAVMVTGLATAGLMAVARWRSCLLQDLTGTGPSAASLVALGVSLLGGLFCWQYETADALRTERPFAKALKTDCEGLQPEEIAFYRKPSPNVLFYLAPIRPVQLLEDPAGAKTFLETGAREKVLVSRRQYLADLGPLMPTRSHPPILAETIHTWEGEAGRKLIAWHLQGAKE